MKISMAINDYKKPLILHYSARQDFRIERKGVNA